MSATNATKSATDATKPATKKDGVKANSITVKTKRKFGGNGGKAGGNGGINTDESVGYEADIIRYVRLHPNATQKSIHTAIGVLLRTIQRTMSNCKRRVF